MTNPPSSNCEAAALVCKLESCRLLLVDDDPGYSTLCTRYLQRDRDCSYEITIATTGQEAVEACSDASFDCVLMDYQLPDALGTEVLQSLRELLGTELPPTVIMTAGDAEVAAISAVRSGAVDFLSKRDASTGALRRTIGNAIEKGRLKRSIALRGKQLTTANNELLRRNEEIQNFYHTVSHEIKTPLTATREFLSILSDQLLGPMTSEQLEMISHAVECCDQMAGQFNDLLDLTRLETGKLRLEKTPQNLASLIQRCVVASAITANQKAVSIHNNVPDDLPLVNIDRQRINQVLSNLLNNAVKFTPDGGEVCIDCTLDYRGGGLQIRVTDTGCGIAAEHIERIFDRLYQIESEVETENNGLGLGLSIAVRIVAQHGGRLRVESEPGSGSTFILELDDVLVGRDGKEIESQAA